MRWKVMSKIIEWLISHNIDYELSKDGCITIFIEKDCVWVNGFGEPMNYDKKITIRYDKYSGYGVYEQYGYSLTKPIISCKKHELVLEKLKDRFRIED